MGWKKKAFTLCFFDPISGKQFLAKKSGFYSTSHTELCGYRRNVIPALNGCARSLLCCSIFIYPSQVNLKTSLDLDQTAHKYAHPVVLSPCVLDSNWGMISLSPNKDICFMKGQISKQVKLKARLSLWSRPKSTELL